MLEIASAVTRQIGSNGNPYQYLYNVETKYREGQVLWLFPSKKGEDTHAFDFEKFVRALIDITVKCHTPSGDTIHAQAVIKHRIKTVITRNGNHFGGLEGRIIQTPEEFLTNLR